MTALDVGPWFAARYDSECGWCFGDIYQGDTIRAVDGEYVCEHCGEEAEAQK